MIAVIQRCIEASVHINQEKTAQIDTGLLILVGIEAADTTEDIQWLSHKIVNLRIFDDENGIMNLSVKDSDGELLVVSQFSLHASTKQGNRPSYLKAASPEIAQPIYEAFKNEIALKLEKPISTGVFGADMKIALINDGPITIIIDSKNKN